MTNMFIVDQLSFAVISPVILPVISRFSALSPSHSRTNFGNIDHISYCRKSHLHAGGKIDTLVRSVEIRIDCARVVSDQFSPRLSEQINISTSTAESAEVKRKHMDRQRMISTDSNNMKFYKSYLTNSGHFLFLSFSSFFFYSASTSLVANHNSVRGLDRRSVSRLVCLQPLDEQLVALLFYISLRFMHDRQTEIFKIVLLGEWVLLLSECKSIRIHDKL